MFPVSVSVFPSELMKVVGGRSVAGQNTPTLLGDEPREKREAAETQQFLFGIHSQRATRTSKHREY